jgi:iron-sulfur cluster assembly accessory protein
MRKVSNSVDCKNINIIKMNKIITISRSALTQFKNIIKHHDAKAIKFSIKGGGCSGFEYELNPTNEELKEKDVIQIIRKDENNQNNPPTSDDIVIHICGQSLLHIIGTHIDWNEDIMGKAFKFSNPNATQSCGCGTSFNLF